ncbi:hypothetical protein PYCC9005_002186 [Savitreella phatthalungensis]
MVARGGTKTPASVPRCYVTTVAGNVAPRSEQEPESERQKQDTIDWRRISHSLSHTPFALAVSITYPVSIASGIDDMFDRHKDMLTYRRVRLPLHAWVTNPSLIKACRAAAVTAIASAPVTDDGAARYLSVDSGNVICIASHAHAPLNIASQPSAKRTKHDPATHAGALLMMSLDKETYQRAGLTGVKSTLNDGKYVVRMPFRPPPSSTETTSTKSPLKDGGLRAITAMQELPAFSATREWTAIIDESHLISICGEDAVKEIDAVLGPCIPLDKTTSIPLRTTVPDFTKLHRPQHTELSKIAASDDADGDKNWIEAEAWREYVDDVLCHLNLLSRATVEGDFNTAIAESARGSVDPYITTYTSPCNHRTDTKDTVNVLTTTFSGSIPAHLTISLVDALIQLLNASQLDEQPWACVHLTGNPGAPMAKLPYEHAAAGLSGYATTLLLHGGQVEGSVEWPAAVCWEVVGERDAY